MRNTGMTSARLLKFGFIKVHKFADKMDDYVLFKNLDGKYLTLKDCIEENKNRKQKHQRPEENGRR